MGSEGGVRWGEAGAARWGWVRGGGRGMRGVKGGKVDFLLSCLVLVRVGAAGRSCCMGTGRGRGMGEGGVGG